MTPQIQPLSYKHRNVFFYLLLGTFLASLPFLFLYASGYRFYPADGAFVSTGGLYIAAERTGAEIYINDELVRETRVFRRAFYAQGLESRTHKIHVQKEGHHTWVKELPVYPHLVTEAQAFNLPLKPSVRVITPYVTPSGVAVLTTNSDVLSSVVVQNQVLFESRAATSTMASNPEHVDLLRYFSTSTDTTSAAAAAPSYINDLVPEVPEEALLEIATTTKESRDVRLHEQDGEIFASYIGQANSMPYYYCADDFPRYEETATTTARYSLANVAEAKEIFENDLMLEVQRVEEEESCAPVIKMDTGGEEISHFDFFPGSTDLVIMAGRSGIYVVEIDDRAWQNKQPLLLGEGLELRVVNGSIYIKDGELIYQVQTEDTWF